ncbi:MAG: hypothetical protein GC157_14560 [Frankiales bacterium]|nr:hypothetical protein [Frankiales bacterium]
MPSLTSVRSRLALLASAVLAGLLVTGPAAGAAGASGAVPYTDPGAAGLVTLCNDKLQPITSGSVTAQPFVWRAVSSNPPPAPWNGSDRLAFLLYAQPRKGVAPESWNGDALTATSSYESPDHAVAQATPIDLPLSVYLKEFPASWDGYVQIRLYYSAPGIGPSQVYAAVNLHVDGNRWTVAGPQGTAPCAVGKATSPETLLPSYSASVAAVKSQQAAARNGSAGSAGGADASSAADSSDSPAPGSGTDPAAAAGDPASPVAAVSGTGGSGSAGSSTPLVVGIALAALGALAALALVGYQRVAAGRVAAAPRHSAPRG